MLCSVAVDHVHCSYSNPCNNPDAIGNKCKALKTVVQAALEGLDQERIAVGADFVVNTRIHYMGIDSENVMACGDAIIVDNHGPPR